MILFFYGPNTYAARQQLSRLTAEYKTKTGGDLGLERIDGAKVKPEELTASLKAVPFLASSRLVVVEDLGTNKQVAPKIERLIADIPDTTVAVFYDPNVDQRTTYFKTLSKAGQTVKFEPLSVAKLQQWVSAEVKRNGAEIERSAVGRLLDLAGEDQWRLSNEIAKLAAFRSPITAETVSSMVEESANETVFNLVEAMTAGSAAKALDMYRKLRADGQNEVYLLSMVTWQLRNLLLAKAAGKTTPGELAKAAGMSPFVAGKALSAAARFDLEELKAAFLAAVDTDYQIKSGAGAPEVQVEQLIFRIAKRQTP